MCVRLYDYEHEHDKKKYHMILKVFWFVSVYMWTPTPKNKIRQKGDACCVSIRTPRRACVKVPSCRFQNHDVIVQKPLFFLDIKGWICHFLKWQIHPFISNRTKCMYVLLEMKGCICHFLKWQIHPFISNRTKCMYVLLDMKGYICHFLKWQIHLFISRNIITRKCM